MATSDPQPRPAQPRVSSGAVFFDSSDRLLLVKPTYKDGWNLPGGAVDAGETPREACVREVREELGIEPPIGPLLLTAWTRSSDMGDKVFFVFDGGILDSHNQAAITLDQQELNDHAFFTHADAAQVLPSWLADLVANAIESRIDGNTQYVELSLTPRQSLHARERVPVVMAVKPTKMQVSSHVRPRIRDRPIEAVTR